ncbi:hypothetical protein NL676_009976 [Syzygium grande]|nr:hypothetical protein NL676_009976 [Syzygium grande]
MDEPPSMATQPAQVMASYLVFSRGHGWCLESFDPRFKVRPPIAPDLEFVRGRTEEDKTLIHGGPPHDFWTSHPPWPPLLRVFRSVTRSRAVVASG